MELGLFWTEFATLELKSIFKYYKKKVGIEFAKERVNHLYSESLRLVDFPEMG